jgi:unsaturated rhamnogalacturonyl hydrolase
MKRNTPSSFSGWSYPAGLFLYGQYLVYKRTGNKAYLDYIRAWADRFVAADGSISQGFNSLDSINAVNVLVVLFKETGQAKYRIAATKARNRLKTYPRTADGGFWHAAGASRAHQLWSDGVFMVNPFLVRYGAAIGEAPYTADEATKQLKVYYGHLLNPKTGLLKHAWDESKKASWADKTTGQAPEHWCRAIGWFAMTTIDVLDVIPPDHPNAPAIKDMVRGLAAAFVKYQDPKSGRWFQVVDKGSDSRNWTETSCSSMYTFMLAAGVERGILPATPYKDAALKGYNGVLGRVSKGSDGLTNITEICVGTNVGNAAFYFARPRKTNDLHGLGAFLIMNEQLRRITAT